MTDEKKPTIVAFCCHYCAYAAADLAGSMRLQYPTSVRVVRTPCTGRLEVGFILKAFESGADAVVVAGCEEGSCHFKDGNLIAKRRVNSTAKLLAESGIEPERVRMVNVSAGNAPLFVKAMKEMAETVRRLGPLYASRSAGLAGESS